MSAFLDEDPGNDAVREGASVVTEHVLAYAELAAALFQAWQRSLQKRLVGVALLAGGLAVAGLLLTFGAIAAAWPTDYRWAVLFGITGVYLIAAAVGVWLLTRPREVAAPASVFVEELRKDAVLVSAAWRERAS